MADSQNTYQNDVKIKSGIKFSTVFTGLLAAIIICFGGYNLYNAEIEKAYNNGYETAKVEEYNNGYIKGKAEGQKLGYSDGYGDGYEKGKEDAKSSSNSSSTSSGKVNYISNSSSNSNNNYYSGSYNSDSNFSSNEKEYDYILNKNTDKFHYSWCYSVNQMKEKNKIYFSGTRAEVISKGYSPCKNCNP